MVLPRGDGAPRHAVFRELPELLAAGDLLVVNRSRVFPARLLGRRASGGQAEVLLLERLAGELWLALVRPGRRLRPGDTVEAGTLTVRIESDGRDADGRRRVRLLARAGSVEQAIEREGHTPLPPYIRRPDRPADRERYQTVYAREPGSVAAPTAGLHFSQGVLARLTERGIERAEVVLHVGPGTFRPVTSERVEEHRVPAEAFAVPPEAAAAVARARARGGRVVAVGTTSVRALEAAVDASGRVAAREGRTELVVLPGHRFRAVDALLTNFHLPRSSLLLLVCAFAGRERVLAAYAEAIREGYRFYSYGDAMLIL
jgi:S-adenosylmethionine:tRNA ribosyltransferase-isomerase